MKKLLITLLTLVVTGTAFSQTTFGIKAGPNFSSMTSKSGDSKSTTHLIAGLAGGVYANLSLLPELYLQPALFYEGKGGSGQIEGYRLKTRLNYLVVPVDLLFKPEMRNGNGAWMIGLGPYFGYAFSAKRSGEQIESFDPIKNGYFNRFDGGVDVQLGAEFVNRFSITAKADIGVINISNLGKAFFTRNTSFAIMLGYALGKNY